MEFTHVQLWERCLKIFKDNLPIQQFDAWFKPITSLKFEENELTISVPSQFFIEYLEEQYCQLMSAVIRKVYGNDVKLYYHYNQVANDPETETIEKGNSKNPALKNNPNVAAANPFQVQVCDNIDSQLNPKYTFENYCCSTSNKVARSISESIATNPDCKTFNPLFIFGSTGVGKTHLINAIGVKIKELNPDSRVLYITARLFESQFTSALAKSKINEFINFYQSIDVLIIDDIQDLIGKSKTQNTFFHIFNHLHQNQKQLILSSDCRPSQMEGMEARLLSRFKWGMTVELEKPDYDLRIQAITQKAKQDGLSLSNEILDFIATNVTDSIRELDGIICSLIARATILGQEITLDLARAVLSNIVKTTKKQLNFEIITQKVCSHFNIEPDSLFTRCRKREISDARQMIMYMAKKHAKMPLTTIGTRLSRTHATVLYACKNIEERLPLEKQLQTDIELIERSLLS